jgi:hypothetical protein
MGVVVVSDMGAGFLARRGVVVPGAMCERARRVVVG